MKKLLTLSVVMLLATPFSLHAQQLDPPKTGALIHVDQHQYKLKPGEEISFPARLVKSKSAKKLEFGELFIKNTDEMAFRVEASADQQDLYVVKAKAAPNLAPGKLYFVLKMTGDNAHRVRSTTLSFTIDSENVGESN